MSITIGDKPEMNVVNVGDELTSDQLAALQNAQGASATNPCLTRTNTFNTADAAVRITQTGTGDAFVVDDDSGDTSPFRIDQFGAVGIATIGTLPSGNRLTVTGATTFNSGLVTITNAGTAASGSLLVSHTNTTSTGAGVVVDYRGTADAVRITNTGTGNSFVVEDSTNPDASPFIINADGNIGIGRQPTSRKMEMTGNFAVTGQSTLDSSGVIGVLVLNQSGTADAVTLTQSGTGRAMSVTGSSYFVSNVTSGGDGVLWVRQQNASSSKPALVVTNQGIGNSFVIEDEASDTTPFVIDNAGNVTLGGSLTLAAGAYSANTAQASVTPDYPHELTFIVGGVTYRVPARAI